MKDFENKMDTALKSVNTEYTPNMSTSCARVPKKLDTYVEFGEFANIEAAIKSEIFVPLWLYGHSGTGKSVMVEQICAKNNRKFVRINFTTETTEEDLLGSWRLKNGQTEFHYGPVVDALRDGAVLLLDEIDGGHTNRILCLQMLLEGKGVFIKATNEFVQPSPKFTVVATSNTQGTGDSTGRYAGTNILNAAFLDRFVGMVHIDYPPKDIEEQILIENFAEFCSNNKSWTEFMNKMTPEEQTSFNINMKNWIDNLTLWAKDTRNSFNDGQTTELITTRALVNIMRLFSIYADKDKAIDMTVSRFDAANAEAIKKFYSARVEVVSKPSPQDSDNQWHNIPPQG